MLDPIELRAVAERFGVGEDQVRRDHLISHVLAALPAVAPEAVFFGGTALSRTHLPGGRLSEDVDLYARERKQVVQRLTTALPVALRREFPGARWDPAPDAVRQPGPALLRHDDLAVRVQVLDAHGYSYWPTERRSVDVRYSDVRATSLVVPTRAAFVGMKVAAWTDRRASRDLYDLWALALGGAVDDDAAATFVRGVGYRPRPELFDARPADDWLAALGHQTADLRRSPTRCASFALRSPPWTRRRVLGYPVRVVRPF